MLCLLERLPGFADLKSEISNLKSQSEGIARQLRAWADSLQNSSIPGQRYLTEKSQRLYQGKRDREEFLRELEKTREAAAAARAAKSGSSSSQSGSSSTP